MGCLGVELKEERALLRQGGLKFPEKRENEHIKGTRRKLKANKKKYTQEKEENQPNPYISTKAKTEPLNERPVLIQITSHPITYIKSPPQKHLFRDAMGEGFEVIDRALAFEHPMTKNEGAEHLT